MKPMYSCVIFDIGHGSGLNAALSRKKVELSFGPDLASIRGQVQGVVSELMAMLSEAEAFAITIEIPPGKRDASHFRVGQRVMACPKCMVAWFADYDAARCSHGTEMEVFAISGDSGTVGLRVVGAGEDAKTLTLLVPA